MKALTVGEAASRTGWSSRMLRYLEDSGLVVPGRSRSGYRLYGLREVNQLASLQRLRQGFAVGLGELAFAARLRREPDLRAAVETWLAGSEEIEGATPAWVEWEQRKHERLLVA